MARTRVAVLISGTGTNMAALLYASRPDDCPYEIALVASNNPDAPGLKLAEAEGVATWAHSHEGLTRLAFDELLDEALHDHDIEFIALAGYMRLLSPDFVESWGGRMLNIHPSLLPKYKGLHTHEAALTAGDKVAGCSVHEVTAELDAGPVLAQAEVAILPGDTPETLAARVLIAEHQLYPRTLSAVLSRHLDAAWIEAKVDELASALPKVFRKTSHGAPGWATGGEKAGKLFAIIADRHHGEDNIGLLVKASGGDEMNALIEAEPDTYYWPKYYGASGWLGIVLSRRNVDWDHVADWLQRSWLSVAPKRLTAFLEAANEF